VDQDLFAARLLPDGATIEIPSSASIGLAAPNPTRSETLLEFGLPAPGYARIRVFDLAGRLVRRLLDEPRPAGIQGVTWDGTDDQGRRAASGVYFVDIQAGEATRRLKITLVR
jgi:flagellar hook assembly protein FlgD